MPDIQTDESDASEIRPEPDQQKTAGSPAAAEAQNAPPPEGGPSRALHRLPGMHVRLQQDSQRHRLPAGQRHKGPDPGRNRRRLQSRGLSRLRGSSLCQSLHRGCAGEEAGRQSGLPQGSVHRLRKMRKGLPGWSYHLRKRETAHQMHPLRCLCGLLPPRRSGDGRGPSLGRMKCCEKFCTSI